MCLVIVRSLIRSQCVWIWNWQSNECVREFSAGCEVHDEKEIETEREIEWEGARHRQRVVNRFVWKTRFSHYLVRMIIELIRLHIFHGKSLLYFVWLSAVVHHFIGPIILESYYRSLNLYLLLSLALVIRHITLTHLKYRCSTFGIWPFRMRSAMRQWQFSADCQRN